MLWGIIFAAGAGTYLLKTSFIPLIGRMDTIPPRLAGVLRFVPAAVLAALVAPAVLALSADPTFAFEYDPAKVIAGGVAAVVAWRTENVLATISVGMVVLWTVQYVVF